MRRIHPYQLENGDSLDVQQNLVNAEVLCRKIYRPEADNIAKDLFFQFVFKVYKEKVLLQVGFLTIKFCITLDGRSCLIA